MNKKVLILNIEVSGMNKYLFAQLRQHGWQLIICDVPLPKLLRYLAMITTFKIPISTWKRDFNIKLNKLYKSPWCFRWRTKQCEKILRKYQGQFDLVINMTGMNAPFLRRKDFPGVKYSVITSYTMALAKKYEEWCTYPHEYQEWIDLETKLYDEAEIIFTTNDNVRYSLKGDYGIDLSKTLNMGYGLTFDEIPKFEKIYDGKTLLFVGFDFKRKGGFVLLESFKKVREKIADARLVIIGPSKKIYQIEQEGVEFLGPLKDREEVKEYFKQASVFVMPSLCEPFGLVLLEAMAYRLPCVGSIVDAMSEIIVDGDTGFLVDSKDTNELADKIIQLLDNQDKMMLMGKASVKRVREMFSWERVGEKVNAKLEGVMGHGQ